MAPVPDIIVRLRELGRSGSAVQKRLARLILSDIAHAAKAPIAALTDQAGVSQPGLSRLVRALGCEGVADFRLKLAQALAIGELYLAPPRDRTPEELVLASVGDAAIEAIVATRAAVDMAAVSAAAQVLCGASQVLVFGSGGISSLGAVEMQNRLFRFGIPVAAHSDDQMQQMAAAVAGPGTAVVGISSSGTLPSLCRALETAASCGARTVAIAPQGSPLAAPAGTSIAFHAGEDARITKPTALRYGLLVLVDLVAMTVAESLGAEGIERLRRVRMSLTPIRGDAPYVPLGD